MADIAIFPIDSRTRTTLINETSIELAHQLLAPFPMPTPPAAASRKKTGAGCCLAAHLKTMAMP